MDAMKPGEYKHNDAYMIGIHVEEQHRKGAQCPYCTHKNCEVVIEYHIEYQHPKEFLESLDEALEEKAKATATKIKHPKPAVKPVGKSKAVKSTGKSKADGRTINMIMLSSQLSNQKPQPAIKPAGKSKAVAVKSAVKSKARGEEIIPNEEEEEEELSECPWKNCNSCLSFSHPLVRKDQE